MGDQSTSGAEQQVPGKRGPVPGTQHVLAVPQVGGPGMDPLGGVEQP